MNSEDHPNKPELRPDIDFELEPLFAKDDGDLGETIANGVADHLATEIPRTQFLVAYAGQGSKTIHELSWEDQSTDARLGDRRGPGGFYATSLDDVRRAKRSAGQLGKPFTVDALLWMQGEANLGRRRGGWTGVAPSRWGSPLPPLEGRRWYRDQLIEFRRRWSADIKSITGQAGEIPLFTYQTLGSTGDAQLMAADLDPNIHLVGPHYALPSAVNSAVSRNRRGHFIHLAADCQRWLGEQFGKVIARVRTGRTHWEPLRPLRARLLNTTSVLIHFHVPAPPLVLDEDSVVRQCAPMASRYRSLHGFTVLDVARRALPIKRVRLQSEDSVRIDLAGGEPRFVSYCTSDRAGPIGRVASVGSDHVALTSSHPEVLRRLAHEGAFFAIAPSRWRTRSALIRFVRYGAITTLEFDPGEMEREFRSGEIVLAARPFVFGNLRDSDAKVSVYGFADRSYGDRAGQKYPLWNWCVRFTELPIN